jgi:hypothetical protein
MKHLVPIHVANYVGSPGSVQPGFKKFYLKNGYFKLYDGANENDVVLDRPLDGFVPIPGTITAADSVLTALEKLQNAISSFGGITGSGTPNRVSKFFTPTTIGDSLIEDNGTSVIVNRPISFATPFRFDVNGTIYCDYGASNVANVPSTLYVNMPFYNLPGGTPDAVIVRINGKAAPANGIMTGYNVAVSGPENIGFYGDFDDTSALSDGIRLNSRPLHTGDFINFIKYTGVIGNSVFRVNNTGDTITNKILVGTAIDPGLSIKAAITNGNIAIDNNRHFISYRPDGLPLSVFKINTSNQLEFNPLFGQSLTAYLFTINGAERMRITQAGDVGMGTNSPSQKLHVSGNARITGAVYDSANSPGTAGQILSSTLTGTAWITSGVTSVSATSPITSSGGTTPVISTSMATNKLIGRSTAGTGVMEEITIGTGLTLSGGTLNASATGGGIPHATASGTDTYTATITGVTAYNDADAYLIRFTNGNTTSATLNINSLGAIPLYRNNDGVLIGGDIINGGEMLCVYNSTTSRFQVIGTAPNSLLSYVTNDDSVTLTKGMPVYAFSGTGDRMTVKRANNTSDATSAQTVGLVLSTSIGVNQKGLIMMQGLLDGLSILPTSTWNDGDPVYLGATAGTITNVKPYAPNHLVYLGVVTTASNGSAGRMYVRVQNGYELQELHNVDLISNTPNNGDSLLYNKTTTLWENRSEEFRLRQVSRVLSSDFIGLATQAIQPFSSGTYLSGSITVAPYFNGTNPGMLRISSSATASSGGFFTTNSLSIGNIFPTIGMQMDLVFRTPNTIIGIGSTIRAGFMVATNTVTDASQGFYMEIVDNQLYGKTANASVRSQTGTFFPISNGGIWFHMRVLYKATNLIEYSLYNMAGALLWSDTLTTNIPTALLTGSALAFSSVSITVPTEMITVDYLGFTIIASTRGALN